LHVLEAQWLEQHLARLPDAALFPLLNVGSSTLKYRTVDQPHVDAHVLAPLRKRGRIIHLDLKPDEGVDVVGNLVDPAFLASLKGLGVRSLMISNLLHHLVDRGPLIRSVLELVQPGGFIIVTGPYRYPRHYDPIDTMYRPTPRELADLFPGARLVEGSIIHSADILHWRAIERGGRSLPRTLARLLLPFYRPKEWVRLARQSPYIVLPIKAVGVVLERVSNA
jgi:SAM-dependent methyltransferase